MNADFPTLDLAAFEAAPPGLRADLSKTLDAHCRKTGFLALTNHGVSADTIARIQEQTGIFFAQNIDEKQKSAAPYAGYPYGYLRSGSEALAASKGVHTPPDLKESFNGGPLTVPPDENNPDALAFCYAPTIWPAHLPGFRGAWQAYYSAMEDLAARIMRAFAAALELPADHFDAALDNPVSALRALHYPAQIFSPQPGQLRAGAHSDYGSLTILLPQAGSVGLEIKMADGNWQEIPPISGAFIINIGDLMARWTNDRWVSTLHRVVNDGVGGARNSLAFFHQPSWHAEISVLPGMLGQGEEPLYPPVRSGPYLMEKFRATAR